MPCMHGEYAPDLQQESSFAEKFLSKIFFGNFSKKKLN